MKRKLNPYKRGFRTLGIAECFKKENSWSVLAGLVMRRDRIIDGLAITRIKVGGLDATDGVLKIYNYLSRKDINVILLNGCIISWFNIIDIDEVYNKVGLPVICISYEETLGIEKYLREYFPGDDSRLYLYKKLGPREKIYLRSTNSVVYVRYQGASKNEVRELLEAITIQGSIPEPLRIAQLVARSVYFFLERETSFLSKESDI